MPYIPIVGTLGYVLSPDHKSVLMIHRNARPEDQAFDKYNGLGGKMEHDEDVAACMIREIREEAGIEVTHVTLRGTISWPGFGKHGGDWLGFIFLVTALTGEPILRNHESTLEWVPVQRVLDTCSADVETQDALDSAIAPLAAGKDRGTASLSMWLGDLHYLPLVFGDDPRVFHGVMPYENGQPVSCGAT